LANMTSCSSLKRNNKTLMRVTYAQEWRGPRRRRFAVSIFVSTNAVFVQAKYPQTHPDDKKQALCNLFAAYVHTVSLEQLTESLECAQ